MKYTFLLFLGLAVASCSEINSKTPIGGDSTAENDSTIASAGTAEAILNSTGTIIGPEITCTGTECSAEIEWIN